MAYGYWAGQALLRRLMKKRLNQMPVQPSNHKPLIIKLPTTSTIPNHKRKVLWKPINKAVKSIKRTILLKGLETPKGDFLNEANLTLEIMKTPAKNNCKAKKRAKYLEVRRTGQ